MTDKGITMLDYRSLVDGPTVAEARPPLPEAPTAPEATVAVRRLDGARMHDLDSLYDEFSAALQFPAWFGRNLDAVDECLRDLALPEAPRGAVALVVDHPEQMLVDAPDLREWFREAIDAAGQIRTSRGLGRIVAVMTPEPDGSGDHWWRSSTTGGQGTRDHP